MATYKKRGAKKSVTKTEVGENQTDSTTAEVFETLDTSASKAEEFVAKYQNIILIVIGVDNCRSFGLFRVSIFCS